MPDMEKVIKGMEQFRADLKPFCGNHADWERFDAGLALLKEMETMMQCIKGKCRICPHCANCDVDDNGLLKEQEAVEPKQVVRKQCKKEHDDGSIDYFAEWYCPHCNMLILRGFDNPSIKFCYKCGKHILWEGR